MAINRTNTALIQVNNKAAANPITNFEIKEGLATRNIINSNNKINTNIALEKEPSLFSHKRSSSSHNKNPVKEEKKVVLTEIIEDKGSEWKTIKISPSMIISNYYNLTRVMPVIQLDNYQVSIDENFNKKKKNLIAIELEDLTIQVINLDTLQKVFEYNFTYDQIEGVYLISYEKCLIFLSKDNSIRIANYITKTMDRKITDHNKSKYNLHSIHYA